MKTRDQAKQNGAFHASLIDWLTNKSNRLTEWTIVCLKGHLICLLYQITEMKNATTTSPVKVMGARCKHDLNWNGWFCPIHVTSNQKLKLLESMMHKSLVSFIQYQTLYFCPRWSWPRRRQIFFHHFYQGKTLAKDYWPWGLSIHFRRASFAVKLCSDALLNGSGYQPPALFHVDNVHGCAGCFNSTRAFIIK